MYMKLVGFILFWISFGMVLMLLIGSTFVGVLLIIIFMIAGFNLYCSR